MYDKSLALERTIDTIRISQRGSLQVATYFEEGEGSNVYVRGKLVENYTEDEWAAILDEFGVERNPTRRELDGMIERGEIG